MSFDFFPGVEEDIDFELLFNASLDDDFDTDDDKSAEETRGEWKLLEDFGTFIEIEPVDKILLELARLEVPAVMDRICSLLPKPQKPSRRNVQRSPEDFFKVWFNKCLLLPITEWLKTYLGEDVSPLEIMQFIQVELILCYFQVSPEKLFNPKSSKNFKGNVKWEMTYKRYCNILSALSGLKNHTGDINTNPDNWKVVNAPNKQLGKALEFFRTEVAAIAFVALMTWFGLDDDQLRLR
jgi:hypothetical protein